MSENKNNPKISVIIPIYNSEQFLSMCIESVQRQAYKNLEIILVDDGSTDRSLPICEEYFRDDCRMKLLSQKHMGVSAARNHGLEVHTGEYVFFMDSDDVIHPALLEQYVSSTEQYSPDYLCCAYIDMVTMPEIDESRINRPKFVPISPQRAREVFHHGFLRGIGGKLIRSGYIGETRFREDIHWGKDAIFNYELILKKGELGLFNATWYYYRRYTDIVQEKKNMARKKSECLGILRDYEHTYMDILPDAHDFALLWEKRLIQTLRSDYIHAQKEGANSLCAELKNQYFTETGHPLFSELTAYEKSASDFCFHNPLMFSVFSKIVSKTKGVGRRFRRLGRIMHIVREPIFNIPLDRSDRRISITFDATFGADNTDRLLQILQKNGAKATFFVSGIWADAFPHKIREIIAEGHEVGNHSDTHPHFAECQTKYIIDEVENCSRKIEDVSGVRPTLMRCPYGSYDNRILDLVDRAGMKAIQWSVDSEDWRETMTAKAICDRIISKAGPGDIILCHNAGLCTPEALETLLPALTAWGYRFVTVSELLGEL